MTSKGTIHLIVSGLDWLQECIRINFLLQKHLNSGLGFRGSRLLCLNGADGKVLELREIHRVHIVGWQTPKKGLIKEV